MDRHDGVRLQRVVLVHVLHVAEEPLVQLHVQLGLRKSCDADRCAGDHDAQVLALANDLLQQAQQDVVVDAPLVHLVHHDDAVLIELWISCTQRKDQRIPGHFAQQFLVCDVLDLGELSVPVEVVVEVHAVSDFLAQHAASFLRNSLGDGSGCDATRLPLIRSFSPLPACR